MVKRKKTIVSSPVVVVSFLTYLGWILKKKMKKKDQKEYLNVGRVWLKFREEEKPFGISIKEKRSHNRIAPGDIIQIAKDYYMVNQVGARQIEVLV